MRSDGSKLWNYTIGGNVGSSPAVINGVVYVGSEISNLFGAYNGTVYALSASDGTKLWSYTTGGNVGSSPAVVDGVVYIGSGDGNVYALSAADGKEIWNYNTGLWVYSSPAVVNGVVYIGSYNHKVYALGALATSALLLLLHRSLTPSSSPLSTSPDTLWIVLAVAVIVDTNYFGITFFQGSKR